MDDERDFTLRFGLHAPLLASLSAEAAELHAKAQTSEASLESTWRLAEIHRILESNAAMINLLAGEQLPHDREIKHHTKSSVQHAIRVLRAFYIVTTQAVALIERDPQLIVPLAESLLPISYFFGSTVVLHVIPAAQIDTAADDDELFVKITTREHPDQASATFARFENEWVNEQAERWNCAISFAVGSARDEGLRSA